MALITLALLAWIVGSGRLALYVGFFTTPAAGGNALQQAVTGTPAGTTSTTGNPSSTGTGANTPLSGLTQIFGGGPAGGTGNIAGDIGAGNSSDGSILQGGLFGAGGSFQSILKDMGF